MNLVLAENFVGLAAVLILAPLSIVIFILIGVALALRENHVIASSRVRVIGIVLGVLQIAAFALLLTSASSTDWLTVGNWLPAFLGFLIPFGVLLIWTVVELFSRNRRCLSEPKRNQYKFEVRHRE